MCAKLTLTKHKHAIYHLNLILVLRHNPDRHNPDRTEPGQTQPGHDITRTDTTRTGHNPDTDITRTQT